MPSAAEVCPECGYDFPAPATPGLTVGNAILLLASAVSILCVLGFSLQTFYALLASHLSWSHYLERLAPYVGGLLLSLGLVVAFIRSLR